MNISAIFEEFPRPWSHREGDPGVLLDAEGKQILTIDVDRERSDEDVTALAGFLVRLTNQWPE